MSREGEEEGKRGEEGKPSTTATFLGKTFEPPKFFFRIDSVAPIELLLTAACRAGTGPVTWRGSTLPCGPPEGFAGLRLLTCDDLSGALRVIHDRP